MISILLNSRHKDNPNSNLPAFLKSLVENTENLANVEVLIKFDSDDDPPPDLSIYPVKIKTVTTDRGQGYLDMHVSYNRLLPLIDDRTEIIAAMADDFTVVLPGWDKIVLNTFRAERGNIFILHSQDNLLDFDLSKLSHFPSPIDECPFWSHQLLEMRIS